jgi:hypothetical protein
MTPTLLHVEFDFAGPWGEALAQACAPLAADIAAEPGLRWKLWTEDAAAGVAGGAYLFDSRELAARYLDKHSARLEGFGVSAVRARLLDVNPALSAATRGPLAA